VKGALLGELIFGSVGYEFVYGSDRCSMSGKPDNESPISFRTEPALIARHTADASSWTSNNEIPSRRFLVFHASITSGKQSNNRQAGFHKLISMRKGIPRKVDCETGPVGFSNGGKVSLFMNWLVGVSETTFPTVSLH